MHLINLVINRMEVIYIQHTRDIHSIYIIQKNVSENKIKICVT